jgi:hypothetical protein
MGLAILVLGIFGVLGLAAVVLLEGLVLRALRWGGLGRSLLDSLLMNMVSTAVGVLIVIVLGDAVTAPASVGAAVLRLPLTWALSVLVETAVLVLIRKKQVREVIRPVLWANLASYVLIAALVLIPLLGL